MTVLDTYIPFDTGSGAIATPAHWRSMGRTFGLSGVVPMYANQFAATISAGVLTIQPGAVWIDGYYGESTANKTVTSVGLGPGLAVVHMDPTARTISLLYRPGVTRPTQIAGGIYEIPLYYVSTNTAFTDQRQFATGTSDWTVGEASNNSNQIGRARTHRAAAYTTSTTNTNYGFDTVDYGAYLMSGAYIFVAPYADDYLVLAQVGFISTAAGQWYNMRIVHNGATTVWNGSNTATGPSVIMCQATDVIPCKTGDTINVQHNCSTTGLQGAVGGYTPFMAVRALSR